jgi:hypothetical protein
VELAVETGIPVAAWWDESDAVIATTLAVLEDRKTKYEQARKG